MFLIAGKFTLKIANMLYQLMMMNTSKAFRRTQQGNGTQNRLVGCHNITLLAVQTFPPPPPSLSLSLPLFVWLCSSELLWNFLIIHMGGQSQFPRNMQYLFKHEPLYPLPAHVHIRAGDHTAHKTLHSEVGAILVPSLIIKKTKWQIHVL